jgi:hypothetical protein
LPLVIDHHVIAIVGLFGVLCDLLGGLYLAYDLFGGPGGPLRTLTEVITYTFIALFVSVGSYIILFEIVTLLRFHIEEVLGTQATFGGVVGLGIGSGIGAGLGYSLNLQVHRRVPAKRKPYSPEQRLIYACLIGVIIGLFGLGIYLAVTASERALHGFGTSLVLGLIYNSVSGVVGGVLVARLLVYGGVQLYGGQRPRFDVHGMRIGLICGVIIGVLVGFGYWVFFQPDIAIAVGGTVGGVLGGVGLGVVVGSAAQVMWWIDHLPKQRMGIFGTGLILVGLAVQALQYLISLLDVHIH